MKNKIILLLLIGFSFGFTTEKHNYNPNELIGKVDVANSHEFVRIDQKYTTKGAIYLRKECYQSYEKMYAKAAEAGIKLPIISAFRSYYHQKSIWEAKWTGRRKVDNKALNISIPNPVERAKKILMYSSMPGSSRHHWGTDIDIYSLNNSDFETGQGLKVYQWLVANAADFGFAQAYTTGRANGYAEEKWHWSYLPTAKVMLKNFQQKITNESFKDFLGAETAMEIDIVQNYVLAINPSCI